MNHFTTLVISLLALTSLTACTNSQLQDISQSRPAGQTKNIILMIGDGMGPQQIGLLQDFALYSTTPTYQNRHTALQVFADEGQLALSSTRPFGNLVVDSACSATQLATGVPALSEVIGLDIHGNPAPTILEKAHALGKSTGLITDTRVTHATPAAFAAHQTHRSQENEIALDILANNVDVLLGGGLAHWLPAGASAADPALRALINEPSMQIRSKREDQRNLLLAAQHAGYSLAFNANQLSTLESGKVLGLFASSTMLDGIAYSNCKAASNCVQPSLAQMTKKALDLLSNNDTGFFLMIEGGQIDWAGHNNDAGDLLHQMLKFDEAVQAVYDWVRDRDDTLVVITADHETGGFGFSYNRKDVPDSSDWTHKPDFNFVSPNTLDKLYAQKKDFYNIWYAAGGDFKDREPSAEQLQTAVNDNTAYTISLADAEQILEHETNQYKVYGHPYLGADKFPKVDDFEAFYVYGEEVHLNLIGRALAKHQNTVWSTGTHTHTPVAVIAWGPHEAQQRFHGLLNHVQVGTQLIQVLEK